MKGVMVRKTAHCKRQGNDIELTVDGSLTAQLLQDLGGTSQSVTRFTDGNVEDELLDAKLAHGVLGFLRL